MTIAIGAAVVEDLLWEHSHPQQADDDQYQQQQQAPSAKALPSLLRNYGPRILLQGCVETASLTMELAISLASTEPCRCRGDGGGGACGGNCVAVTLLMPGNQEADEPFPLLCQPDCGVSYSSSSSSNAYHPDPSTQQALQRIQVRRVTSLKDLFHYLLSIAGLPTEQHPVGGILVAELDQFVHSLEPAAGAIQMTQVAALLMDTAACLKRMYNYSSPKILVTVREATSATTSKVTCGQLFRTASTFWSPCALQLARAADDKAHKGDTGSDEVAIRHWSLLDKKQVVANGTLLQNLDQEQRIVYSANDSTVDH